MKNLIKYAILSALMTGFLGGCGKNLMNVEQESQAIWQVKKSVENALNGGDAKTLRSMFAEDPVFVICNGPVVEGLEAIEKMHMDFFRENPGFKTEFKRQHISFPTRDVAIETVSFIDRFPGQPLRYGGDTTVYVKEGGQWKNKYIRMHTSVPDEVADKSDFNKEAEGQEIWRVRQILREAMNAADTKRCMSLMTEDSSLIVNGSAYHGIEAIEKVHDDLFQRLPGLKMEFKRINLEFLSPTIAVEDASYVCTVPNQPTTKGLDSVVWIKQDGQWLTVSVRDFFTPSSPTKENIRETENEADIKAIRKFFNDFCTAHEYNDGTKLAEFYTDDALLMPSDEPIVSGKAAIASRFQQDFEKFTVKLTTTPEDIEVSGNLAFVRGTFKLSLIPKTEGEKMVLTFKGISILRKGVDGSWKTYCDIWNSDASLPPKPKDLTIAPPNQFGLFTIENPVKMYENTYEPP